MKEKESFLSNILKGDKNMNAYEEHMANITGQMRQELVGSGFTELTTG